MMRLRVEKEGSRLSKDAKSGFVRSFFGADLVEAQASQPAAGLPIGKAQSIAKADRFLENNSIHLMKKSVSVQQMGITVGQHSQSISYQQKHKGIPVYGAQLIIGQRKHDGIITSAVNNLDSNIPDTLEITPKVTAEQVKKKILEHNFGFLELGEPKIYIYRQAELKTIEPMNVQAIRNDVLKELNASPCQVGKVNLIWQIFMHTNKPDGSWELILDAENGNVIEVKDRRFYAALKGNVFCPDPVRSTKNKKLTWDAQDPKIVKTLNEQICEVDLENLDDKDKDGKYNLNGKYVRTKDIKDPTYSPPTTKNDFKYDATDRNFGNVMAYYYIDRLVTYLTSLGNTAYNESINPTSQPTSVPITVDPQGSGGCDYSFFDIDSNGDPYISFGEDILGNTSIGVPDATDPAVIVHEYGHLIHHLLMTNHDNSNIEYEEGFCDFLAACWLDRYNKKSYKRAEVMIWERCGDPPKCPDRRVNLEKKRFRFDDPNFPSYDGYLKGDVHASALWDIFLKIGGRKAKAEDRINAADEIISLYLDMLALVKVNKPLKVLVEGLIQACKNRNGQGAVDEEIIRDAYDKRGCWDTI